MDRGYDCSLSTASAERQTLAERIAPHSRNIRSSFMPIRSTAELLQLSHVNHGSSLALAGHKMRNPCGKDHLLSLRRGRLARLQVLFGARKCSLPHSSPGLVRGHARNVP
jgi:hypothetical protein